MEKEIFPTRYLRCSSAVTVGVLKKFLIMKFAIPETHSTEVIRSDEILDGHLTMKEVCRIYGLYSKPFVDLQYVFLEKNESAAPVVKPKIFDVKRKRIKKKKGNKNLLKKCLSPNALRKFKKKGKKKAVLSSIQGSENADKVDMGPSQARPFENEKKENLVPSSIDLCANVKKEDLGSSLEPPCDKVTEESSLPQPYHNSDRVSAVSEALLLPNMDNELGRNLNENEATVINISTVKSFVDNEVAEALLNTDEIDNSLMVTPVVNGLIREPSDQTELVKVMDTSVSDYASDMRMNHLSADLESSALLHGLLLESS